MTRLFRSLAASAAAVGVASVAAVAVSSEPQPAAKPPVAAASAKVPTPGQSSEMKFAVDPKPLSDAVKKGLKYLAAQQQADGGWSQGGGWRTNAAGQGGRVEGAEVTDPSDVGNTCIALLALIRAGNTPTQGEYKDNVQKGLRFVYSRVEKADKDDLYVTDVRNTQLQSKIGPFVDTFLSTLVLSEIKGKAGDDEKRLVAALDKTIGKIAKHQKDDGTIAGNGGWAPVLSQALCNKSLARAYQNGVSVDRSLLANAAKQSEASLKGTGPAVATPAAVGEAVATTTAPATKAVPSTGPSESVPLGVVSLPRVGVGYKLDAPAGIGGVGDAGVPLYRVSQGAGNLQDVLNSVRVDTKKAREVLKDGKAGKDERDRAERVVKEAEKLEAQADDARQAVAAQAKNASFVAGFGNNGGEEFLSFLNISEMLVVKGDKDWTDWDTKMQEMLAKAQDKDGSWSGHHCITGKTFCTGSALLVMLADRTPFPVDVIEAARAAKPESK